MLYGPFRTGNIEIGPIPFFTFIDNIIGTGLHIKGTVYLTEHLLLEQNKSIVQIAEELGFSSQAYFSGRFTEKIGVPPSKYAAMVSADRKSADKT